MDYSASGGLATAGTAGTALAYTGVSGVLWLLIAAVALIAAGSALMRFVPRKKKAEPTR